MIEQLQDASTRRAAATLGLVMTAAVAVVLGIHPPGSTPVHDDPMVFVDTASTFFVLIHVVGSLATLGFVVLVALWASARRTPMARAIGTLAVPVATIGVAVGVIHMIAVDSVAPAFYADTLATGGEGAVAAADLMVRIHAGTITTWSVVFWFGLQALLAAGSALDGERGWRLWVPAVGALLALASIAVTLVEKVLTTVADMGLFRPSVTLFLVWGILLTVAERRALATEDVTA